MPQFLSDAWMDEAKKIREEVGDSDTPPAHKVRMNMVIIDCPEGVGTGRLRRTPTWTRAAARSRWTSATSTART